MNYALTKPAKEEKAMKAFWAAFKKMSTLIADEKREIIFSFVAIIVTSTLNLLAPLIVGHTIDTYIQTGQYQGVLMNSGLLLAIFLVSFASNYVQMKRMGGVGQRVLFRLRNTVFNKLQELPIAFFNQNKAGDLISRINNDTDKLNQFFSESLMRFMGSVFMILGAGIFLLAINFKLALAALAPAAVLIVFTQLIGPWVKSRNAASLTSVGALSGEVQESLNNFKVIVAFNRRDYFRERFERANIANFKAALGAGFANGIFTPIYDFTASFAILIVIGYGLSLIASGAFTIGFLISFLLYVERFYAPFRQMAQLWSSLQVALAGWDRVSAILDLKSNLKTGESEGSADAAKLLEFKDVHFRYPDGKEVLHGISFGLERGKTYALVGPTGGGKTTTASLMARLYDPTEGSVRLDGRDISSYSADERVKKIGFILQEPFLFTGTVRDNILYGNAKHENFSNEDLAKLLEAQGLGKLLARFDQGLETPVTASGDSISLGQKQLIAFMRAVLREPELLILDEATANIDTVTEQLLEEILEKLPKSTTKVVIAHRLNTIQNADEIFFVNDGSLTPAGSFEHAVDMLMHDKRQS